MNQKKVDELTARINSNTEGTKEVVKAEADEIKAAIESSSINTEELEKAIAASEELKGLVSGIYTAPVTEDEPVEEPPVEYEPVKASEETPYG